ncbi:MAG: ATP-binding protein [Candidatus Wallbacteria bacterium HGW-Wallbacteria-1]|jgi:flagellar biosynthesis protein FlhG|uniref:ATP-binding protein n=1 Tax=Candidatus Wallbacteria bacterium HGW-Wallbacteria-1 TaxID=2013854 RepID=A0A2N1PSQ0_9BACT|nr:MAG: ATP-binding protein [Candidatus Wallbacteria bacterium HGW-Wallbacteria-1]
METRMKMGLADMDMKTVFPRLVALPRPEVAKMGKRILSTATSRERTHDAPDGILARTIAITSGKGGVGKTHLAANLAIKFARAGKRVMVLDADLGLANLDIVLGVRPRYSLAHVIKGEKTLKDVVFEGPEGIRVIAGGSGLEELADLGDDARLELLSAMEQVEDQVDIMIIDTGAGLSRNVLSFLKAADEIVVISTPEPSSLADAYGVIKATARERKDIQVSVVANRVWSTEEAEDVFQRLSMVSRQFLGINLKDGGFVFEDPVVSEAVRKRSPFVVMSPSSRASACMDDVASRFLEIETHHSEKASFFRKVAALFN